MSYETVEYEFVEKCCLNDEVFYNTKNKQKGQKVAELA